MPLLFAYGTLLDEHVQRAVFGRHLEGRPDVLAGFVGAVAEFRAADGSLARYPNIVQTSRPADTVPGRVFELSDDDLRAADGYETSAYERQRVTLASGTTAWVYVSGSGEPDR
jgi:gamma-glutamylcyclotransferase (GGCT)/AIG2-like uncharacterized protein YtfP